MNVWQRWQELNFTEYFLQTLSAWTVKFYLSKSFLRGSLCQSNFVHLNFSFMSFYFAQTWTMPEWEWPTRGDWQRVGSRRLRLRNSLSSVGSLPVFCSEWFPWELSNVSSLSKYVQKWLWSIHSCCFLLLAVLSPFVNKNIQVIKTNVTFDDVKGVSTVLKISVKLVPPIRKAAPISVNKISVQLSRGETTFWFTFLLDGVKTIDPRFSVSFLVCRVLREIPAY